MSKSRSRVPATCTMRVDALTPCPYRAPEPPADPGCLATAKFDEHDPVIVYEDQQGTSRVIDGMRRLALAKFKGVETVSVYNLGLIDDEQVLELVLRTGLAHEGRNRFVLAGQIEELARRRPILSSLRLKAEYIGCSHTSVRRAEKLLALPDEIQSLGRAGKITPGRGLLLLRVKDAAKQAKFAEALASSDTTASESARTELRRYLAAHAPRNIGSTTKGAARQLARRWQGALKKVESLASRYDSSETRQRCAEDLRNLADQLVASSLAAVESAVVHV